MPSAETSSRLTLPVMDELIGNTNLIDEQGRDKLEASVNADGINISISIYRLFPDEGWCYQKGDFGGSLSSALSYLEPGDGQPGLTNIDSVLRYSPEMRLEARRKGESVRVSLVTHYAFNIRLDRKWPREILSLDAATLSEGLMGLNRIKIPDDTVESYLRGIEAEKMMRLRDKRHQEY